MTMHPETPTTKDETKTPPTPTRGESAVRHLWKRATEEDRTEDAKLIATVANLLQPSIKLSAGLPFKKPDGETETEPKKVDSAQVDGAEVDLSEMEDRDARDYAAYAAEMDGSAARERHIRRMEDEDAEMAEIHGGRHDGG